MSMVQIDWRPGPRGLRKFGLVVIIGFGLVGLFIQFTLGQSEAAFFVYGAAVVLGLPALTGTVIALPGYWLWMGVAFVMGQIMGRVLLTAIYYGMITPMGVVRRLVSDKLRLRPQSAESYWTDVGPDGDPARYERLF